ncbi:MAG TPA: LuxR C-terminal-related transcriptional regulator [Streptosporangiaceae bacterium]|jgi:two-component system, NarL family, nitrate/nitrite response regulator NarL|nr:LuxR C-terminal-related transcriptional regulator [Streptosporangiaceae bacterium]
MPELCELRRPDVVIFDAGHRVGEICRPVDKLVKRFPELNVIVTYREADEDDLSAACRAGVASLVPESHGLEAVVALLRRKRGRHARPRPSGMTDRELEVLMLAGSGHSVPEMAELLGISPLTVENLKRRIYAKLDVNSGAHAVSTAASLGILDRRAAPAMRHREPPSEDFPVLTVVSGQPGATLDQVVRKLLASAQPFVLVGDRRNISHSHWARWHRGPIIAALVDPEPADWGIVEELSVPAILVHSKPLDSGEVADALANGASSLVQAETIEDHFLSVLRMAGQGYLVVDSKPMRPLIGAVRARWERQAPGSGSDLPELTARECDILRYGAEGYSIRQTARLLGIAPKTVENIQTHLFRKLGVRNRAGAVAVASAFGLLPGASAAGPLAPPSSSPVPPSAQSDGRSLRHRR